MSQGERGDGEVDSLIFDMFSVLLWLSLFGFSFVCCHFVIILNLTCFLILFSSRSLNAEILTSVIVPLYKISVTIFCMSSSRGTGLFPNSEKKRLKLLHFCMYDMIYTASSGDVVNIAAVPGILFVLLPTPIAEKYRVEHTPLLGKS